MKSIIRQEEWLNLLKKREEGGELNNKTRSGFLNQYKMMPFTVHLHMKVTVIYKLTEFRGRKDANHQKVDGTVEAP